MAGRGGAIALVALCVLELALRGAGAGAAPAPAPAPERLVPAMFVFGDSTVDVGNNNQLPGCKPECRANYPRYGVDYPSSGAPTGRFSNGKNLADHIAIFLGFDESPPAFQSLWLPAMGAVPQHMKGGINFASGGSGLQNTTGRNYCGRPVYSMADQLEEFTSAVDMMGEDSGDLISTSLFFISVGSNDLFEYAYPWPTPSDRNDTAFLGCLVDHYKTYLQELYAAGARKFSIVSPSLVGCCPSQRAVALTHHNDTDEFGCFRAANDLSRQLYPMLASMLQELSRDLDGMNYSLCDSAGMAARLFTPGGGSGFNLTVLDTACCAGAGRFGEGQCNSSATLCPNRANFMFWDGFHPTDAAASLAALEIFTDTGNYLHPMNVGQLAAL
ncbi:GDSL esterase/lipase At1g71691-like [Hordeum vulgare subsp. vulgare]|uniref:GDSL esterase/lipase n=1 Tax=Hordeum vulgare subsp. vulgare TaxID=112509 RepID=A0A8I6WVB5_HORVV|nr:GDSL esterase/lipase At1g71691-like [Hordeum vulgare subsp. vulgare]